MESNIRESVSRVVLSARNEIITNTSPESQYESLARVYSLLPSVSKSDTQESQIFVTEYYYELLSFLLSEFDSSWFRSEKLGKIMGKLVMQGPSEQAFIATFKMLCTVKPENFQFQKILLWISDLLESGCIEKALCVRCRECHKNDILSSGSETFRDFIQLISSLPSIVLSRSQEIVDSSLFIPEHYCHILSKNICSTLSFCHKMLTNNENTSVIPISKLLSKMCIVGYGTKIWKHIIANTSEYLKVNLLWRRVMQQVMFNLDDWSAESTLEPLIFEMKSPEMMQTFLGILPLKKKKLETLLTHKLILCRYFSDITTTKIILVYLAMSPELLKLFEKVFINVLEVWSQKTLVKHRPFEQTHYLCQILMVSIGLLSKMEDLNKDIKEKANKALLDGLPLYLNSTIVEVQQMGMIVAQNLSVHVYGDVAKLELPIEKNEFTSRLISLMDVSVSDSNLNLEETIVNANEIIQEIKSTKDLDSDDDDDDDDDLRPLSAASKLRKSRTPIYLAQCIEGLSNYDDVEFMNECLKHCEHLIKNHPELRELHLGLCKTLLYLEDRFSFNDFHALRHKALVSLIVRSPELIADYLTNQFYERNYNISQRLEMLDVLVDGAKKLSFPSQGKDHKELDQEPVKNQNSLASSSDWQQVVQQRIDLKTRRFAKDRSKIKTIEFKNRFSTAAGWFFYPLMKNFYKECFDLHGEDHLLLEKLLNSLASIIYCSINIPIASSMAKTLLQFSSCYNMHQEVGVRRSVLHCTCMCLLVLEAGHSLSSVSHELIELHSWLNALIIRDSDTQSVQLANQILGLLGSLRMKLLQ